MLITRVTVHTRYESKHGDDDVSSGDLEELLPWRTRRTSISNLLKHDILVKVDAIEPGIE